MLVTDGARAHLEACTITACQGPALDASLRARLSAADCSLTGCVGAPPCAPVCGRAPPPSLPSRPIGTWHARCLKQSPAHHAQSVAGDALAHVALPSSL